jgi:hypothetical protein
MEHKTSRVCHSSLNLTRLVPFISPHLYASNIHFNITLPSKPILLPLAIQFFYVFRPKTYMRFPWLRVRITKRSQPFLPYSIALSVFSEITKYESPYRAVFSPFLALPKFWFQILFSALGVVGQNSFPFNTTCKITVLLYFCV